MEQEESRQAGGWPAAAGEATSTGPDDERRILFDMPPPPAAAGASPPVSSGAPGMVWRGAREEAAGLARRLHYLGWPDRAVLIDELLWTRARTTLSSEQVTAVINRLGDQSAGRDAVPAYAAYCGAVVSGALAVLAELTPIRCDLHALALLVSDREEQRKAAIEWLERDGGAPLIAALIDRPGHAFMILARTPSDTAQSFIARDAFFAAMLGRPEPARCAAITAQRGRARIGAQARSCAGGAGSGPAGPSPGDAPGCRSRHCAPSHSRDNGAPGAP